MINYAQKLTYVAAEIWGGRCASEALDGIHGAADDLPLCLANIHRPDPGSQAASGRQKGTSPRFF